jgi:hypothetical protein
LAQLAGIIAAIVMVEHIVLGQKNLNAGTVIIAKPSGFNWPR